VPRVVALTRTGRMGCPVAFVVQVANRAFRVLDFWRDCPSVVARRCPEWSSSGSRAQGPGRFEAASFS